MARTTKENPKALEAYKKKFDKFEKANNGNFKCPVCKRSMFKTKQAVANHAIKCKGRSSTSTPKDKGTVVKPKKEVKGTLGKYKRDLATAKECLRTAKDKTVITKTKARITYLNKKIKELK